MGKLTTSMAIFNVAILNFQRVAFSHHFPQKSHQQSSAEAGAPERQPPLPGDLHWRLRGGSGEIKREHDVTSSIQSMYLYMYPYLYLSLYIYIHGITTYYMYVYASV